MMSCTRPLVLATSLILFSGVAGAQEDEEYGVDPTLTGPYVGGSLGATINNFDGPGDYSPPLLTSLILGYRGSEYISLESEFEWLGVGPTAEGDFEGWFASLGFRVHFPIGRIEPYLTYGGGVLNVKNELSGAGRLDRTDFAMTGGGGLAFQFDDQISFFAEGVYTWPIGGVQGYDFGAVRFGLLYKFIDDDE